jgi:hypothetical protein
VVLALILLPIAAILLAIIVPNFQARHARKAEAAARIAASNAAASHQSAELPVPSWSPTLSPNEKPDLFKIREEAKDLMNRGQYDASLQHYLWYYFHAREYDQTYNRLFILSDWVELGRRYPKAKQALLAIRNHGVGEFEGGGGYGTLFQEISEINRELSQDDATYYLFKKVHQEDPKLAQHCYFFAESLLVNKGEYELCAQYLGDPQRRFEIITNGFAITRFSGLRNLPTRTLRSPTNSTLTPTPVVPSVPIFPQDAQATMKKVSENNFVNQVCQLIEILVGTHRDAEAQSLRDQAIEILDDPKIKTSLSDATARVSKKQNLKVER